MKSKILFILHLPPPVHGAAMMGKYIHDSELINRSFECLYINGALAKDLSDIGKGGFKKLWNFIKLLNLMATTIKREKPDLCYVTPNAKGGAFYKDFVTVMLLKLMGQKIILHYHNKGVSTRQDKYWDNLLYKHFFGGLKIILLADSLYSDIKKYVKKEDIYICPNGIPATLNNISEKNKKNKVFHILFLSNMMKEKGVWDLIEACKILKDTGCCFHCDFVGKWSDIKPENFESRIKEYNLEKHVTAHGAKYGNEKNRFLQQADVFVFPTHNETFGLVLLEAMEYGISCIGTEEGGIPSVIDNEKTGYIIEKKRPDVIAEKIAFLMKHLLQCMEMGKNGRNKFLCKFTLDIFEKRMKEILEKEMTP